MARQGRFFPKFLKVIMINFSRFARPFKPRILRWLCQFDFFKRGGSVCSIVILESPWVKICIYLFIFWRQKVFFWACMAKAKSKMEKKIEIKAIFISQIRSANKF